MYATKQLAADKKGNYKRDLGRPSIRFWLGRDQAQARLRKAKLEALWAIVEADGGEWNPMTVELGKAVARGSASISLRMPTGTDPAKWAGFILRSQARYGSVIAITPVDAESFEVGTAANRKQYSQVVESITESINGLADTLGINQVSSVLDLDPTTLHEAIEAFRDELKRDLPKLEDGNPKPNERKRDELLTHLIEQTTNFPLHQLDKDRISQIIGFWRNRPTLKRGTVISQSYAEGHIKELDRFFRWLDDSGKFRWTMPKGVKNIPRSVPKFASERKLSAISKQVYSVSELASLNATATQWQRLSLYLSLNCSMGAAELGRIALDDFYLCKPHPHADYLRMQTSGADSWLRYFRPKTDVFGEWYLWPETVELVQWGIKRAKQIGSNLLFCRETGSPLYNEAGKNPQQGFANLWHNCHTAARRTATELRYLPFGSMRDTLPDYLRATYSSEIASISLTHGVPSKADNLIDCYSNRPFGKLHDALRQSRAYYAPVFAAAG